jgi:hypothetical protein
MNNKKRIRFVMLAAVLLIALAVVSIASGQQFNTKSPTAADWAAMAKLPDFNGVWERGGGGAPRGNQAAPAGAAGAAPQRGGGQGRGAAQAPGRGGGAGGGGRGGPSFTPQYEALRVAAASAPQPEDNSTGNCLPPGMPGIMGQPYPMEFLLTPGKMTIVIEAYTEVRHIYTDGRPLPEDPDPKFFGTSIGHWEGDTLVVETIGFSDHVQHARGVPHGDKMKIVERFRLADPDTMTIETTISDPGVLTAPYTTSSTLKRHRNWTIAEYICEENNRNYVDQTGKAGINLSVPGGVPPKTK